ncbi:hypothetical protein [Arthrobacter sp. zg-Y844]|uniref:hypothetical protein n=1 Tax=Arthrobacter sp. zg-Y844 TaxID=2964612 RepID=UPI0021059668|nr:hypothetical protein [Arthrobacter sp. zg-Y844]MCQ1985751.1 hypothetical protein [Arthrobacter sp. zg-Y844]
MITLQQDNDGFIRMDRHFPASASIAVRFSDGTSEVLTGARLNKAYDDAVAVFRAKNHLDAKGFSRVPKKVFPGANKINVVPVQPGMGD